VTFSVRKQGRERGDSLVGNIKHPYRVFVLLITTEAIMKANTQKAEQAEQSLNRAINGQSVQNDMIVMKEFSNRGIVATPRVDVFTYNIWKFQKGRQVKKGEKSVKVRTFIEDKKTGKTRCSMACLFHISQTDSVEES
tara:strand:+ start:286 stop:699 length:414 start_codon:yes stop_codon:yes gene_type:complete